MAMVYDEQRGYYDDQTNMDYTGGASQTGAAPYVDPIAAREAAAKAAWARTSGTFDQRFQQMMDMGMGGSVGITDFSTLLGVPWEEVVNSGPGRAYTQHMESRSNPLSDVAKLGLGSIGFGVGGMTGAAAMTGNDLQQAAMMDLAGLASAPALAAGTAAMGGVAAGGGATGAAPGAFTGGFTGTAAGVPEFSGLAAGAPGVNPAWAGGSLAPGFFAAEAAAPLAVGGAGLSGLGTAGAATEAAGAAPTVAEGGILGSAGGASGVAAAAGGLPAFLSTPAVLGAAGGALLGSGILGGGTEAGSIQIEEGIPDWLMPYVKPQLDAYSTEMQNYNTDPYGVMPAAMQEFKNTIGGMYLDPSTNKYLEDYFRMGSERVKSSLAPTFGHMQAFGAHSGYNEALSRGLGDFATGLYGGAYAKERDRQSQMTSAAPQFLEQNTAQQFAPYQQYLSTVGSLGRKKQEPYFENQMGNMFGGAMAGMGLGSLWK